MAKRTAGKIIKTKSAYKDAGVSYGMLDPVKIAAQKAAKLTGRHLKQKGGYEIAETRGESAYVWKQGSQYFASVIEGLGTKNLVADAMRKHGKKTYYDTVAHDTVATIINDLITVGARPLVLHAYWAVGDSAWFADKKRSSDLVTGWKQACDIAGVVWGGGETPAYAGIIDKSTIDLAGSAVGMIPSRKHLITERNIRNGDRILLVKSNGINANGLTLARKVAAMTGRGFAETLPSGKTFGEALLAKSNIYARLIAALQDANVNLHYIVNITGHGLRKLMRPKRNFTYIAEKLFKPQEEFLFIQKTAGLSDYEMYETFNMGQDFALYVPERDSKKALKIITSNDFVAMDAGVVRKGKKEVILKSLGITYSETSLRIRS